MKKILLTLIIALVTICASAQCTPDPQYVGGGIYPTAGTFNATINQPFSDTMTVITPADTAVTVPGFGAITADILSIELTGVNGLPPNFTYECDPADCNFPGGTTKCARVYSTIDPTASDIGLYPISFECTAHLTAPFVGAVDCTFVEDGYAIQIGSMTSVIHQFNNQTFQLSSPFPNPVMNRAEINFIVGKSDDIMFRIYNLLGKQVYFREIRAIKGVNSMNINTINFPEGLYMYSINNGKEVLTKRMIIVN